MVHGRRLTTLVVAGLVTMAGAVAGACSDSGSDKPAPGGTTSTSATAGGATTTTTAGAAGSTTVVGTATTVAPTATTGGGTGSPGEVTVRATVALLFASARVLQLDPAVNGYSRVALGPDTEYRRADGSAASFQDVEEGSSVEVTGEPGATGTLIARLVVLV
jgi:hypothetical protein